MAEKLKAARDSVVPGNTRKEQYGADRVFFEQRRHFYGDWLNLEAIKSAMRCYKKKHDVSRK